jgi:UDP-glucose 4-epimerase
VYGDTPTLPKHEDMVPAPLSPYAASKLAGEHFARVYASTLGLDTISLRYFNVFGPRQDPGSQYAAVIPLFLQALHDGRRPVVFGDGRQSRDFTHVDNVVEANLAAAACPKGGGAAVNIACGDRYSLLALLDALGRIMGRSVDPQFCPARVGDVLHSQASIDRARELLKFQPHSRVVSERTLARDPPLLAWLPRSRFARPRNRSPRGTLSSCDIPMAPSSIARDGSGP